LAGNTATIQLTVAKANAGQMLTQSPPTAEWQPASVNGNSTNAAGISPNTSVPLASTSEVHADTQAWPASLAAHSPYRLYDTVAPTPADTATRYGNPAQLVASSNAPVESITPLVSPAASATNSPAASPAAGSPEVFRQVSVRRLPPTGNEPPNGREADAASEVTARESQGASPILSPHSTGQTALLSTSTTQNTARVPAGVEPKQVGSRSFELEYHFENLGRWGVSRVELWGTRNGGQSWRRYTEDADLRSPMRVTVEDAGLYGFRIVAEAAGGTPPAVPQPGDAPELWVEVDLHRPIAEILAVEPGSGNQADQLMICWRADDDNIDSRPVSLFYSSRPVGPWSAIATNLENTGHYAWRLDRYLPQRGYLRLEVRDAAGNVGAFQTIDPIPLEVAQPSATVGSISPLGGETAATSAGQR
jgi:hypothetical protein